MKGAKGSEGGKGNKGERTSHLVKLSLPNIIDINNEKLLLGGGGCVFSGTHKCRVLGVSGHFTTIELFVNTTILAMMC